MGSLDVESYVHGAVDRQSAPLPVVFVLVGWADVYVEKLKAGETVQFRPRGNSMVPRVQSGDLCTVDPITNHGELAPGDIVLCRVNGSQYLHLVIAVDHQRFQIGNNRGRINGWVAPSAIFGKLVRVEH